MHEFQNVMLHVTTHTYQPKTTMAEATSPTHHPWWLPILCIPMDPKGLILVSSLGVSETLKLFESMRIHKVWSPRALFFCGGFHRILVDLHYDNQK